MALAPEPYLSACLDVLEAAILKARRIGCEGHHGDGLSAKDAERLAYLMDAVHNIPGLLQRWEECDEPRIRQFLGMWDDEWGSKSPSPQSLLRVYERHL